MTKKTTNDNPTFNNESMLKAGDLLKARRLELGKSIEDASDSTKIQKRYLIMIEENKFDGFESEVFLKGFLRSYSSYLGLKPDMMLAIYRRDMKDMKKKDDIKKLKKDPEVTKSRVSAKLISQIVITLFVVFITGYLFYQLYNFQKIPELSVSSPENNTETTEDQITVKGRVDANSRVTINDITTEVNGNGNFEESIPIDEGVNTIRVKAVKINNSSKESVEILTITRKVPVEIEEPPVEELPEPILNVAKLEVVDSEAWLQLLVDGKQELGEVVQPGFSQEYTVNNEIELISGKVTSTRLFVNGEVAPVQLNISEGVGRITCKLENNRLNCDN